MQITFFIEIKFMIKNLEVRYYINHMLKNRIKDI